MTKVVVLRQVVGQPVQRWLCAPAAGVAVASAVVVSAIGELRPAAVPEVLGVTVLALATTAVTTLADPAGALADATPTPAGLRLAARAAPVLATVWSGWAAVLVAAPDSARPPVGIATRELVALVGVVLAVGATEVRWFRRSTEPVAGAAGVVMAWAALCVLRPRWSPFAGGGGGDGALTVVGLVAVAVLAVASSDRFRFTRAGRARWR